MKILAYDVEADDLNATKIYCVVTVDLHSGEVTKFAPDDLHLVWDHLCSADRLIGHNALMFDNPTVQRLLGGGRHLPATIDTLVMSRFCYPDQYDNPVGGHSLQKWGEFLGSHKIEFHDFTDYSPEMMTYCVQDVQLTIKVYKYLITRVAGMKGPLMLEHQVSNIIQKQINNGVQFFPEQAHRLIQELDMLLFTKSQYLRDMVPPWFKITFLKKPAYYYHPTDRDLVFKKKGDCPAKFRPELLDGPQQYKMHVTEFNPGSTQHIARHFMERRGWKPKKLTPTGNPVCDEGTVKRLGERFPEAKLMADMRMYNKRRSQVKSWMENHRDGRLYGDVITIGTVTGRMSHSNPNLAQIPKVKTDDEGNPLFGERGRFGAECRQCFGPRNRWAQVGCDAAGLQARLLGHYMAEFDGGLYADVILNGDIHSHNQQMAGLPTRDNAKTFFYGYLFGAGAEKIGKIVKGNKKQGQNLKDKFKKDLKGLAELEDKLKEQCTRGYIEALDGRHIPLREDYRALNSLLMSAEAIVMKRALVIFFSAATERFGLHGEKWALMLNVHDEAQMECVPEIAEGLGQLFADSIQQAGEYYNLRIRLDGDYKVGSSWYECH